MTRTLTPKARRGTINAGWTLVDQGLSSLTNAVVTILVGRSVSTSEFGAFALAFLVFSFTIGTSRAAITDPLVIRYSAADDRERRAAIGRATASAFVLGLVVGLGCVVAGLIQGSDAVLGSAFLALGIIMPGVLLQDAWRYSFFASARPRRAALNDLVWAVLQFASIAWLFQTGRGTVFAILLCWGLAAGVAAVFGIWQARVVPQVGSAWEWLVENRQVSARLGADYVVNQGAYNAANVAIGPVSSLQAVGALAAARTLLGPLNLLYSGTTSFVLPAMVRIVDAKRPLTKAVFATTAFTGGVTAVWLLALLLMPRPWGEWLFGANWAGASEVILPTGWSFLMVALCVGAGLGLKARAQVHRVLRVTLVQAPLLVVLGIVGARFAGGPGAAWGFATAQTVGLVILLWNYRASEREHKA